MVNFLNIFYNLLKKNKYTERKLRLIINQTLDKLEKIFYPYPQKLIEYRKYPPKKTVLFSFGGTGDIAIFSSFTFYLKSKYPRSKLISLIYKNNRNLYVASLDPSIDKVIPIELPRFFNFSHIEKIKKKYNFDLFIYLSYYPNLRFLMPNIKFIHMPYFIARDIPMKIPPPRLKLDFQVKKENYIFINFDILTFNFSDNYLQDKEVNFLLEKLTVRFPKINFLVNDYEKRIKVKRKNLLIFSADYKSLLKKAACSKLFISFRNGLCDVVAASTKNLPMLIIFPEDNYPNKWGTPFSVVFGMKEIGYPNPIEEYNFNKKKDKTLNLLFGKIVNFINKNYGQQSN